MIKLTDEQRKDLELIIKAAEAIRALDAHEMQRNANYNLHSNPNQYISRSADIKNRPAGELIGRALGATSQLNAR